MFGLSRQSLIIAGVAIGLIALIWVLAYVFGTGTATASNGKAYAKINKEKVTVCPRTTQIQNGIGKICVYNCEGELYRLDTLIRGCPDRLEF